MKGGIILVNIITSIAFKKDIVSILIIKDGKIQKKVVEKIKDSSVVGSNYATMIYSFTLALRHLKQFLQTEESMVEVCFEVSNSIFVKWVNVQYSKEQYQDKFEEALELLHELPIRYAFCHKSKPVALTYACSQYCRKPVLSGLDLSVEED